LNIFNKQRAHAGTAQRTTTLQRTTPNPTTRSSQRLPATSPTSPDQALQRIHAAADQAREEIAALVKAEHEAIGETIASASGDAERRLRGATERRIDLEMKRVEEAGNKLRRDLRRMIRVEVSKVAKASGVEGNGDRSRHPSVPIRARV